MTLVIESEGEYTKATASVVLYDFAAKGYTVRAAGRSRVLSKAIAYALEALACEILKEPLLESSREAS